MKSALTSASRVPSQTWPRRYLTILCFAFGFHASACSRCGSEKDTQGQAPEPSKEPQRVEPAAAAPRPELRPAVSPTTPPQWIACGRENPLEFYRITNKELDIFEITPKLPPPEIRGSSVARKSMKLDIASPLNLLSLPQGGALVTTRDALLRIQLGKEVERYAPIQQRAPLVLWSSSDANAFEVRGATEPAIFEYRLPTTAPSKAGASEPLGARSKPLPGFDLKHLILLSDGVPLYSTEQGLVRGGEASSKQGARLGEGDALFADPSPKHYWVARRSGALERWNVSSTESPERESRLDGAWIDSASDQGRLAVLSLKLNGQDYHPTVTVFENGLETGRLAVAPLPASLGQPDLDLCLIGSRPWVVVGGLHWLQLLNLSPPRLLAEW